MRRLLALSALFTFVSNLSTPNITAQSSVAPTNFTIVTGQGCPVAVSAQRRAPYTTVETGAPTPAPNRGYLFLHFAPALTQSKNHTIVAATVVLHGTDNTPRSELAATNGHAINLTETFNLGGSNDGALHDSQVSPHTVINVRWLSIAELRYADGSTWHPSDTGFCHITPNGFQLVNATAR